MKITSYKLIFLALFVVYLFGCQESRVYDTVEFEEYSYFSSKGYRQTSVDTFTAKRTLETGEAGKFMVRGDCYAGDKACRTKYTFQFNAPVNPGIFWAVGRTPSGDRYSFPINVVDLKNKKPCLLINSFTFQAYSRIDEQHFYATPYNRPIIVSLDRPIQSRSIAHGYNFPSYELINQLNINAHVFDDLFLHENTNLLASACSFVIFSGHPEYWTSQMVEQIMSYIRLGGNILNMSANIGYWMIKFDRFTNSISVDKRVDRLKQNRLKFLYPDITTMLGGYYVGYPIVRYASTENVFNEKYPVLSLLPELDYDTLRLMNIVSPEHSIFKCLTKKVDILNDEPLRIELDGVTLKKYSMGVKQPQIINNYSDVKGSLLTAWAVYGKSLKNIVVARDYVNLYGGRIMIFGSIGWADKALNNNDIGNITRSAIALLSGVEYKCE